MCLKNYFSLLVLVSERLPCCYRGNIAYAYAVMRDSPYKGEAQAVRANA